VPLTQDYKKGLLELLAARPGVAAALLREGVGAFLNGELEIGKGVLRDYINATIGFEALSKEVTIPSKSLMRMLGRAGNPQASNLFAIIGALQRHAGIELHLAELPPPKKARVKTRKAVRAPRPEDLRYPEASRSAHGAMREAGKAFKRR
jgi:DNA-binding phage protein